MVPEETEETATEWFGHYIEVHEKLGNTTRGMFGDWNRYAASYIGTTPPTKVKPEQIIALRNGLTQAAATKISAKRAANLWSDLVKAPLSRAFTDDDPRYSSVRVGPASANPALGIKPPVTTAEKAEDSRGRQPLMPSHFRKVLAVRHVDGLSAADVIDWVRLFIIAAYTFVRPEELYGLRCGDVDWETMRLRVRRALQVRTGATKRPKTKTAVRDVPIHPNLVPLLKIMCHGRAPDAALVPLATNTRDAEKNAAMSRRVLLAAGITDSVLLEGDDDHMPFDFRSWRTAGCSWHAMLGTDSWLLAKWAGHKSPETTWSHYAKEGPDALKLHGEPFPALPEDLLDAAPDSGGVLAFWSGPLNNFANLQCEGRDLNPHDVTR